MDSIGRIGEMVRKKNKVNTFLPDDLIPNILSRLPAKSAIRFRLVCRRWRDLTFDPDFVDLHFRNSIPNILVANPCSGLDLFALDKWWEPKLTLDRFPFYGGKVFQKPRALFSNAGLVVFHDDYCFQTTNFIILNPASSENVRISVCNQRHLSYICGVYFHPSLKEYCSLWMIVDLGKRLERIQYRLLNLGSNPSMKKIKNPFSNRIIKIDYAIPLFIKGYLYWMLQSKHGFKYGGRNDIMEFDIVNEEFRVMPCPVPLDTECGYYQTHIVNIDGILSFPLICPRKITIWRLEDHGEQFGKAAEYTFSMNVCGRFTFIVALAVVDGKLALWSGERLLVCNLMEGTVTNYEKSFMEGTLKNYQTRKYSDNVWFLSHQMSLASLRNCKPTIYIDEVGQVVEEVSKG